MEHIRFNHVLPQVFAQRDDLSSEIWQQDVVLEKGHLVEAESGKGKSTFCSYVTGYRNDYDGQVLFDGRDTKSYKVSEWSHCRQKHISLFGEPVVISGISISSHAPGGAFTSATPDGRMSGETLADGSVSPVPGTDKNGPLAILQSAMRMSKGWSVNLLNMKFTPNSLKTDEDKAKLAAMIRTYLTNGGKHVQFNVVSSETLRKAKQDKVTYRDLIVRVAGYSTYYVTLTERIQNELIARAELSL